MARIKEQIAALSDEVRKQSTVIASVKSLVQGLRDSLEEQKGELDAAGEAEASGALDEVIAALTANAQALAEAAADNTQAEGEGGETTP